MARSEPKPAILREAALPRPQPRDAASAQAEGMHGDANAAGVPSTLDPVPSTGEPDPASQAPAPPAPSSGPAEPIPRALALRLGWLAAILLLAYVWFQQNVGTSTPSLVLASSASAAVLSALGWVYGKKELEAGLRSEVRRRLDRSMTVPVLSVATLVVLVFGTLVTSVKVLSETSGGTLRVRVAPEGSSIEGSPQAKGSERVLRGPGEVASILCFTAPLGRAFYADVTGYQRHSFDLYPWIGKRIRVERDLARAPSLLVRVPSRSQSLLPGGRIELWTAGESPRRLAQRATSAGSGAVLFGQRPPIPESFVGTWERELRAGGLSAADAEAARAILAWQRPVHEPVADELVPGAELTAHFYGRGIAVGEPSGGPGPGAEASARILVGSQALQDVLLGDPAFLEGTGGGR